MEKQQINDFKERRAPDWMNLSKPLTNKPNVWYQASSFHQLQIKSTLCGSTCTELISVLDFEDTSCCSLFLIFGGRSSEIRDGTCRVDDERQLYLIEMVDNEFSTCLSYKYNEKWLTPKQITLARYGHSSVFDKEKMLMYVFGGMSEGNCSNDLAIFDVVTSLWTIVDFESVGCLTIPQERYGHNCAIHNNWMFVCGGMDSSGNIISGIQAMSIDRCFWLNIQVESLSGRSFFTMDILERRENDFEMVIAGGIRKDPNEKPLQRMTISIENEKPQTCSVVPIETKESDWDKYGHCSVFKNQTLLLVGGHNQDHSVDCNSLEYSIDSGEFSSFSYFLQPSDHCSLSYLNISQESGRNSNDGFYFASLLYDSTLNCYVVGGNSKRSTSLIGDVSETIINDTWLKIISFLNYYDLQNMSLVSKRFYSIGSQDVIWKPILFKFYSDNIETTQITCNYKDLFQKLVRQKISSIDNTSIDRTWPIKRDSHYKREIDFIPPNITCPTRSMNISVLGNQLMVKKLISKLTGKDMENITEDSIHTVQFYFHHYVYQFVMDTRRKDIPLDQQQMFKLKLVCISLGEKKDASLLYSTIQNGIEESFPTIVLGLEEELYKISVFKKIYHGKYFQHVPQFATGKDLNIIFQRIKSIGAFEKISTETGFGMHQLLEYFLSIINLGPTQSKNLCEIN